MERAPSSPSVLEGDPPPADAANCSRTSAFARALSGSSRLADGGAGGRWPRMPGRSAASRHLEDSITRVAEFDCPVLLTGETGCGKEEIARAIHAASPRAAKPFIAVNCGGLVATLAEGQLFGHEKGAFTGAVGTSLGAFRAADGGIVFLDEIGEMPLDLQPKLLHVLQRLEVTPVGSARTYAVDVQVIAATNRNLDQAVATGSFREDLLYRLNTIHISVPPLRARKEDIPRFISHFSAHFARKYDRRQWWPGADTLDRLVGHPWPGNVRQLAQTIQRIYVFHDRETAILDELFQGAPIDEMPGGSAAAAETSVAQAAAQASSFAALPPAAPSAAPEPVLPVFNLDELRRLAVRQALAAVNGHRGRAAELLGVSLNTMTRLVAAACPDIQAAPQGRKPAAKPK